MTPKISIIILNWNRWQDTIECVESVLRIPYPNYEIVIVDNGSTDESVPILSNKFPNLKLIKLKQNIFYAGGNNVGIRYALDSGARYIMLLNNDTVVHPDFLNPLVEAMEDDSLLCAVGGTIYYYDEEKKIQNIGGSFDYISGKVHWYGEGCVDVGQFSEKREVNFICGAAIMLRSDALKEIGGLDESFVLYAEELDWCLRARKKGYKLMYIPNSKVFHKGAVSSKLIKPFMTYLLTRNIIWLVRRHGNSWEKMLFHLSGFFYRYPKIILGRLYRREFKLFIPAIQGIINGYMALPKENPPGMNTEFKNNILCKD